MEVTFRTDQLRKCYEQYREGQRAWGEAVARKYIERINILKRCVTPQDVRSFRKLRLHKLTGKYEGRHAVTLHDRWRLLVTFEEGPPVQVRIGEVTQHYDD